MKIRKTILSVGGIEENLSEEVYKIIDPNHAFGSFKLGVLVQKISGMDDSPIVGYHPRSGWVTICTIDAENAKYVGVPFSALELVE